MHAVIFSGGIVEKGIAVDESLKEAELILAADSGAERAVQYGIFPSHVLGDFDSLSPETREVLAGKGVVFESFSAEKDETDTELAVVFAKKQGAIIIDILGGVDGNRLDHVLANVFLTFYPGIAIRFINGNQISWITKGPETVEISAASGDLLSLLPLSETVEGITTTNLQYPLRNGDLFLGKSRGISNVLLSDHATVFFSKGTLLFVHTLTEGSK